jgi:hypothetical protein
MQFPMLPHVCMAAYLGMRPKGKLMTSYDNNDNIISTIKFYYIMRNEKVRTLLILRR